MSDNSLSSPEHLALAHRLVVLWANSRGTQPEPAERDLALWIVERIALARIAEVEAVLRLPGDLAELRGPREALESWTGVAR